MRLSGPLAKANDFQRDCSVETFLTRAIDNTLAASPDFLKQFVVSKVLQNIRGSAGVSASGYSRISKRAETCLQNAGWT
jgi:hypothetical protein